MNLLPALGIISLLSFKVVGIIKKNKLLISQILYICPGCCMKLSSRVEMHFCHTKTQHEKNGAMNRVRLPSDGDFITF